jgi:hypothetical protein
MDKKITEYTLKEFESVKSVVEYFLELDERCRNDDKWLTYQVFNYIAKQYNKQIYLPFELFQIFPAFETVKRMRAVIQNKEKKFCPTDLKVIEKRKYRKLAIKNNIYEI